MSDSWVRCYVKGGYGYAKFATLIDSGNCGLSFIKYVGMIDYSHKTQREHSFGKHTYMGEVFSDISSVVNRNKLLKVYRVFPKAWNEQGIGGRDFSVVCEEENICEVINKFHAPNVSYKLDYYCNGNMGFQSLLAATDVDPTVNKTTGWTGRFCLWDGWEATPSTKNRNSSNNILIFYKNNHKSQTMVHNKDDMPYYTEWYRNNYPSPQLKEKTNEA